MSAPVLRRRIVMAGLAGLSAPTWLAAAGLRRPLAAMTEGPFYPAARWRANNGINASDWDADLTQVQRGRERLTARGEHLALDLRVLDRDGRAIDRAEVEIWQCDVLAAYRHPNVSADADRFDAGFQGFGATRSGTDGAAAFRTIRPVPYPGRTPHIHVKVQHPSFGTVISQLFLSGDPGNERDFLWRRLAAADRDALALRLQPAGESGLRWQARHDLVVPV
jgi:protocatechuate 3,4-dioxygenase beta subunit